METKLTRKKATDRKKKKDFGRVESNEKTICINKECKLRKQGCKGFEGCPGYKTL